MSESVQHDEHCSSLHAERLNRRQVTEDQPRPCHVQGHDNVTRLRAGLRRNRSSIPSRGQEICVFSTGSKPAFRSTHSAAHRVQATLTFIHTLNAFVANTGTNVFLIYRLSQHFHRALHEKLALPQLIKKTREFRGTRRFITAFTRSCQLPLPLNRSINQVHHPRCVLCNQEVVCTSKHNCLRILFIMLTTTCFGHCGPSSGHKNL